MTSCWRRPPTSRSPEDETATLASRLAALEAQITPDERAELDRVADGSVRALVRHLVDAVDADVQAKALEEAEDPDAARQQLIIDAVRPLAANPDLRARILELRRAHDRVIDEVSADTLLDAFGVVDPNRAKSIVESWQAYLDEHRSEITAIQLLAEAKDRRVSFDQIKELADRIARPPYQWTPDVIWNAYLAIEDGVQRPRSSHRTLTDLVSLIRFTLGEEDELVPYGDRVQQRYRHWLMEQNQHGVRFTDTERWWLDRIVQVIAVSAGITPADLDSSPFIENGGADGAIRDLGDRAARLIEELNMKVAV